MNDHKLLGEPEHSFPRDLFTALEEERILRDPSTRRLVHTVLVEASTRDPVDAIEDVELALAILTSRDARSRCRATGCVSSPDSRCDRCGELT